MMMMMKIVDFVDDVMVALFVVVVGQKVVDPHSHQILEPNKVL
jgi:hypothetical protein